MMSDLPHVLYKSSREKKKHSAKDVNPMERTFSRQDIDEATAANEESIRRSRERRRMQEQGFTIDEVFNGAADED